MIKTRTKYLPRDLEKSTLLKGKFS